MIIRNEEIEINHRLKRIYTDYFFVAMIYPGVACGFAPGYELVGLRVLSTKLFIYRGILVGGE